MFDYIISPTTKLFHSVQNYWYLVLYVYIIRRIFFSIFFITLTFLHLEYVLLLPSVVAIPDVTSKHAL